MYFYHNHQNENRLKLSDKSGNLFPAIYLHQELLKKKARQRQELFEELEKETRGRRLVLLQGISKHEVYAREGIRGSIA